MRIGRRMFQVAHGLVSVVPPSPGLRPPFYEGHFVKYIFLFSDWSLAGRSFHVGLGALPWHGFAADLLRPEAEEVRGGTMPSLRPQTALAACLAGTCAFVLGRRLRFDRLGELGATFYPCGLFLPRPESVCAARARPPGPGSPSRTDPASDDPSLPRLASPRDSRPQNALRVFPDRPHPASTRRLHVVRCLASAAWLPPSSKPSRLCHATVTTSLPSPSPSRLAFTPRLHAVDCDGELRFSRAAPLDRRGRFTLVCHSTVAAPCGNSSLSTSRYSATNSFRANATIPIFRCLRP